jgi:hypothetical protein
MSIVLELPFHLMDSQKKAGFIESNLFVFLYLLMIADLIVWYTSSMKWTLIQKQLVVQ